LSLAAPVLNLITQHSSLSTDQRPLLPDRQQEPGGIFGEGWLVSNGTATFARNVAPAVIEGSKPRPRWCSWQEADERQCGQYGAGRVAPAERWCLS